MSKVGAVWIQEGRAGAALKIKFREQEYMARPNKFKKEKWEADFIIYSRDELPERNKSGDDDR